jgi:hypothetical protein
MTIKVKPHMPPVTKQEPIRTRSWLFTPATHPERFAMVG